MAESRKVVKLCGRSRYLRSLRSRAALSPTGMKAASRMRRPRKAASSRIRSRSRARPTTCSAASRRPTTIRPSRARSTSATASSMPASGLRASISTRCRQRRRDRSRLVRRHQADLGSADVRLRRHLLHLSWRAATAAMLIGRPRLPRVQGRRQRLALHQRHVGRDRLLLRRQLRLRPAKSGRSKVPPATPSTRSVPSRRPSAASSATSRVRTLPTSPSMASTATPTGTPVSRWRSTS